MGINRSFHLLEKYNDAELTTAAAPGTVIVKPVGISDFDYLTVTFRNHLTAITFLDMTVQVAQYPDSTAADTPPRWVTLNTGILAVPSALGATAVAMSTQVLNCWNYMRILGRVCQTAAVGRFSVVIAGRSI